MIFKTNFNKENFCASYTSDNDTFMAFGRKISTAGKRNIDLIVNAANGVVRGDGASIPIISGYIQADDLANAINQGYDTVPYLTNDCIQSTLPIDQVVNELSDEVRDQLALTQAIEIIDSDKPAEQLTQACSVLPAIRTSPVFALLSEIISSPESKVAKMTTLITALAPDQKQESQVTYQGFTISNVIATAYSGFRLWIGDLRDIFSSAFSRLDLESAWKDGFRRLLFPSIITYSKVLTAINVIAWRAVSHAAKWLKKTFIDGADRVKCNGSDPHVDNGFIAFPVSQPHSLASKLKNKGAIMNVSVPGGIMLLWSDDGATLNGGFKPSVSTYGIGNNLALPLDEEDGADFIYQSIMFDYVDTLSNPASYLQDYNFKSAAEKYGFGKKANEAARGSVITFLWWLLTRGDSSLATDSTLRQRLRDTLRYNFSDIAGSGVVYNLLALPDANDYSLIKYTVARLNPQGALATGINDFINDLQYADEQDEFFLPYWYSYNTEETGDIHITSDEDVKTSISTAWTIAAVTVAAVAITAGAVIGVRSLQNAAINAQRNFDILAYSENASVQEIRKAGKKANLLARFNPFNGSGDNVLLGTVMKIYNLIR